MKRDGAVAGKQKEGVGTGARGDPYEGRDPTPPTSPDPFERKFGENDSDRFNFSQDFGFGFADYFGAKSDPRDAGAYPGPSAPGSRGARTAAEFFAAYEAQERAR